MVATTAVTARVERSLRAVRGELEDLPKVAEQWTSWTDLDRVDFSLEWDHLMADYLTELDEVYRGGQMTADQQACYRALVRQLKDAQPLVERLQLYPPPVSLDT
ncbi:MAG: hypothetical protein ACRDI2_19155 [Chloroflexota bacterium]